MKARTLLAALAGAGALAFSAAAIAQTPTPQPPRQIQTPNAIPQIQRPGNLTLRAPDLQPIASRIRTGTVSVRNTGSAASPASIATVNCHLPDQEGGCPEIPAAALPAYTNPAYPNRLVVNIPAISAGHVHSHHLTFWDSGDWPSGSYVFEFVVDAGTTVAETNEGNNTGTYTWVVP